MTVLDEIVLQNGDRAQLVRDASGKLWIQIVASNGVILESHDFRGAPGMPPRPTKSEANYRVVAALAKHFGSSIVNAREAPSTAQALTLVAVGLYSDVYGYGPEIQKIGER